MKKSEEPEYPTSNMCIIPCGICHYEEDLAGISSCVICGELAPWSGPDDSTGTTALW